MHLIESFFRCSLLWCVPVHSLLRALVMTSCYGALEIVGAITIITIWLRMILMHQSDWWHRKPTCYHPASCSQQLLIWVQSEHVTQCQGVTDGQTDGQTSRRWLVRGLHSRLCWRPVKMDIVNWIDVQMKHRGQAQIQWDITRIHGAKQ